MEMDFDTLSTLEKDLCEQHVRMFAFSKQAHRELKLNIARLFDALSFSKNVQALYILCKLGCVKDTRLNIESFLNRTVSCAYSADNQQTEWIGIVEKFNDIEKNNLHLCACAADALEVGRDVNIGDINVCSKCGYLLLGESPDTCIMCNSPKGSFRIY